MKNIIFTANPKNLIHMKAGRILLALAVLAMAAGVGQAQTNRNISRAARQAMIQKRQAEKDSIEKAKAQAVIDSLNRVEEEREKQSARRSSALRNRVRNRARGNGSGDSAETADVDVSAKTGETQQYSVSKSSTQVSGQTTVDEKNTEKGATDNKEGANGRASRPSTGSSSSGNQQATGSRPSSTSGNNNSGSRPSSTSGNNNSGSRPSSTAGNNNSGSRPSSTSGNNNSGSRPSSNASSSSGSRPSSTSGNNNSGSRGSDNKQSDNRRGGIKGRSGNSDNTDIDIHGNTVTRQKAYEEGFSYFSKMDNATSLTVPAISEANLPSVIQSNGKAYVLTKETHDARTTAESFFATNYENIYPGAIVWADASLANGDPTLVGLSPGAITLRVDFNTGGSSRKTGVANTADEVQEAIYSLVREAKYRPAPSLNYKSFYSSSAEEMAVSMKANLSFLNNKANVTTNFSKSETHVYQVQDYTQRYYTVSVTQESDKSKYFGDNVPWSKVSGKLGERNYSVPMAIITSVTYGRRAYKIYKYSSRNFKFSGDESIKMYGQSLASSQEIAENSETKDIWLYLDGGDVESNGAILAGTSMDQALSSNLAYNPSTSQGVPISYTVRFLATGKTATVSTTGSYTTYSYQELPTTINVTFRNNATHIAGAGLKMRLDYKVFKFDANGNKVSVRKENQDVEPNYTRYVENNIGFGDTKQFNLKLNPGEFLDGTIRFQVRCKTSSSANWHNDVVADILPDQYGIIDLDIHGAIRPGGTSAYIYSSSYTVPVGSRLEQDRKKGK